MTFSKLSPVVQAATFMTVSAVGFGLMNTVIRVVGQDMHVFQVVFFRNFFALLCFLPMVAVQPKTFLRADRLTLHITRSITGLIAMYMFFYSLTVVAVADTVALTFTAPLFVLVGAAMFLGETVKFRRWAATFVGFIGMLIIIQPGTSGFNPLSGFALLSSLFMAISFLFVKFLSGSNHPNAMVFIMAIVTTIVSFVPMLFVWQMPTPMEWFWLFSLGLLGAVAHLFFTRAFKVADASAVMPFDYLRLPFTALFAFFWFGEVPGIVMWAGAGLIVAATVYIARREAQLKKSSQR